MELLLKSLESKFSVNMYPEELILLAEVVEGIKLKYRYIAQAAMINTINYLELESNIDKNILFCKELDRYCKILNVDFRKNYSEVNEILNMDLIYKLGLDYKAKFISKGDDNLVYLSFLF